MERSRPRRKPESRSLTSGPLGNIEWLLAEHGGISLSEVDKFGCVAAAADQHMCYAMLARRQGETVIDLLHRLDKAIAEAAETSVTVDEVNPPESKSMRP